VSPFATLVLINAVSTAKVGTVSHFSDFATYQARCLLQIEFRGDYWTTSDRFWVCVVFPEVAVTVSV
jgi:hypothetical protein